MNDHRDRRHRRGEPAWPTGDDPDATKWPRHEEPQERTGFWSPLWDDDDEPPPGPVRPNGRPGNGRHVTPAAATQPAAGQAVRMVRPPAGPAGGPGPTGPTGPTVRLPRVAAPRPRTPHDNSQDPTEVMPRRPGSLRREPDLLTHREGEVEEEYLDDARPIPADARKRRRKKIWRRIRRTMYVLLILMIVGPVLAFFITYQFVTVPNPDEVAAGLSRDVTIQYANGQELTKITPRDGARRMVSWDELKQAQQVLNAVFAAEDNTFMTNAGFDLSGVLRAGYNQLTGGAGGGSTITQQYIKQATQEEDRNLINKGVEVVKAYKMNRTFSKEEIITAYLNTIYLGRNAYGIAAAAQAYYGKPDLKTLTPSEAALLAGMIQSPGRYKDEAYMQKRWNFVMDQLVSNGWLDAAQRKAEQFPTPIPYELATNATLKGPRGMIKNAAYEELRNGPLKLTEEEIASRGYTIVTTIDPQAQELAEQAVAAGLKGQPDNLRAGLVAVDPKTGEVKAYYGGNDGQGTNWAAARQEPGSSWKPFDLVALLQSGKGLGEAYDGSSPRRFPGDGNVQRRNSDGAQCRYPCTVADAMKRSINTVFFEITLQLGTQKVADAAKQAGITSPLSEPGKAPTNGIAIGGDNTQVSTLEMASAYATFAARGVYRTPHIVSKVLNPDGSLVWEASSSEKQAFDADPKTNEKIARNVTEALLPVPKHSNVPCADGRLCAGKTGTHQLGETGQNAKAWMVGYTPQISTAVSLSGDKGTAIENAQGGDIYGARVPGAIWKKFMDSYHKTFKLPKEDFGRYEAIGKAGSENASSSSKKPDQQPTTSRERGRGGGPPQQTTTTTSQRFTRPSTPFPTFTGLPGPGDGTG